jgi:lactoylglutathione lyase
MTEPAKPRAVGLNHIALEVGDIEEALEFYGRLFRFELPKGWLD